MLASHGGFPREDLVDYLTSVADDLRSIEPRGTNRTRRVDMPGKFMHNTEMPPGNDKLAFLQNYRFNIQPENSLSKSGGYTTEKIAHALIAGAVPVTWGDPPEPLVFNSGRILRLDENAQLGGPGIEPPELMARVRSLESDERFRAAFFQEPVLMPSASTWVQDWCATGAGILRKAIEGHAVVGPRLLHPS